MKVELHDVAIRHPAAAGGAAPAVQGVTLSLQAGEAVALIGPSGAGKTTLMQALACALRVDSGSFLLDGRAPWRLPTRALQALRGELFLAPQLPPLPPRQRVVTAVLAGRLPALGLLASLRALVWPDDLPAAQAALERFDLGDKLFERVDRLSAGERQRVGLARALLSPARFWIVDEPLAALDPARARQALSTLVDEARARGVTLVTSLHQVELAMEFFPRVVALRGGRLAFDLAPAAIDAARLARLYDGCAPEAQEAPAVPGVEVRDPFPVFKSC